MNDQQILTIALASAPTMLTVLIGILLNNARLSDIKSDINARMGDLNNRMGDLNDRVGEFRQHMDSRLDQVDVRLDETKELWRSELHRVEEILDARLKHLENR
jgi:hypothetical protein